MSDNVGSNPQTTETNGETEQSKLNGDGDEHVDKSPASNDEKIQDTINNTENNKKSSTTTTTARGGNTITTTTSQVNRPKKRKKAPRDATAPKQPLTGYFRFLNDRREKVRSENPSMSFADLTKVLAAEWSSLPPEQKQQYLDAAEQDKERYNREFSDYKQTEAYKLFSERQSSEKHNNESKKERNGTDNVTEQIETPAENNEFSGFDIPIFTEEFLDHNKSCESELRQLRKATSDYEAQNAVLQRHVDSLHAAVNRLESETNQQKVTNESLRRHLDHLRMQLASRFSSIPLPGLYDGANLQNIDGYFERLESLLNSNADPSLRNAAKNAIAGLETIG